MGNGAILWPLLKPSVNRVQLQHAILGGREQYILPEAWDIISHVFKEHEILVTFIILLTLLITLKQKKHITTASYPKVSTQLIASERP